jgi:hypothetical protein
MGIRLAGPYEADGGVVVPPGGLEPPSLRVRAVDLAG